MWPGKGSLLHTLLRGVAWLLEALSPVLTHGPLQIWSAGGSGVLHVFPTQDLMAKVRAMLAASKNLQTSAS